MNYNASYKLFRNFKVPFVNYPLQYKSLEKEIDEAIKSVLNRGDLILREDVEEFEKNIASFLGVKYAVGVNSCTDAMILSLKAAGIKEGDEVITVSHTFFATIEAIHHCGAKPILVDVREDFLIDPDKIEEKITKRTKAILPVHLNGRICDMEKLMEISRKHNLIIIEDAAQALGATFDSKKAGSFGLTGCFDGKTTITTDKGLKRICKIREGDNVLTHLNRYRKVIRVFKRIYEGNWYRLKLRGMRSKPAWRNNYLTATEEHPILVNRDKKKEWVCIKDIKKDDLVYIQKSKCKLCGKTIPFYWELCEYCNPAELPETREKISQAKNKGKLSHRAVSKFRHFYNDILPFSEKMGKEGYKVIPIGIAVPDLIAIKGDKVIAYEIENQRARKRQLEQYGEFAKYYDEIKWVEPPKTPVIYKSKNPYFVDEDDIVCVPIETIEKINRKKTIVYNLEVEEDHSYYAAKVAVHNCFSFYPAKLLGALGDGGIVATNNGDIAEKIRLLRNHGQRTKTEIVCYGFTSRLHNLQAAILNVKFKYLPEWIKRRREIAKIYNDRLSEIKETPKEPVKAGPTGQVKLPPTPNSDSRYFDVYQNYVLRAENRDKLFEFLKEKGVETLIKDPVPNHWHKRLSLSHFKLPFTEKLAKEVISLPMYPELTQEQIEYVINCIRDFYAK